MEGIVIIKVIMNCCLYILYIVYIYINIAMYIVIMLILSSYFHNVFKHCCKSINIAISLPWISGDHG